MSYLHHVNRIRLDAIGRDAVAAAVGGLVMVSVVAARMTPPAGAIADRYSTLAAILVFATVLTILVVSHDRLDRPGRLAPPRPGRAQRLDPGRPGRPAAAGPRARHPGQPDAAPVTIYPFVFHVGPLEITGYGLMMMIGFLMAGWSIQADLRERGFDPEYGADIIIAAVVGGLVGAKVWYVVLSHEWDALFRRGGFVWYGGFLGGVVAVLANGWRLRVHPRYTMELTGVPLAVGYALGRVGCFLVNDDYGIPTTLPWGMRFPRGLPPTTVGNLAQMHVTFPANANPLEVVAVHPTELYETAFMFLAFMWLWRLRSHRHAIGWRFGVYLVLAGSERFLVEFVRAKDDRLFGAFSLAQVTSVLVVLVGVLVCLRLLPPEPAPALVPARLARTRGTAEAAAP